MQLAPDMLSEKFLHISGLHSCGSNNLTLCINTNSDSTKCAVCRPSTFEQFLLLFNAELAHRLPIIKAVMQNNNN